MLRLSQNTAMILGFSLAGLLVGLFGPGWAIGVDAATFAASAVCFTAMKVAPVAAPAAPAARSVLNDLTAGAREVFRHTWLWTLLVQALIYHLIYGGVQGVLGPVLMTRRFGDAAWGWALAALMAGFMIGGVVTLRFRPRRMLSPAPPSSP